MLIIHQMQLNHHLPNRHNAPGAIASIHKRIQRRILATLNINLQDIDIRMLILIHQRLQRKELRRLAKLILSPQSQF